METENTKMQMELNDVKVKSFGEILAETEFSEANDDTVSKVRRMIAELANIVKDDYNTGYKSPVKSLLFDHAIGEIMSAQGAIEKVINFNK
jgi:hypothetical protein